MNTFTRKSYGRIYVAGIDHIDPVKGIIKELDAFEYEYLPDDFIVPFSEYPNVVYTHKFCDMDIDKLTALCWKRGYPIWCVKSLTEFINGWNFDVEKS